MHNRLIAIGKLYTTLQHIPTYDTSLHTYISSDPQQGTFKWNFFIVSLEHTDHQRLPNSPINLLIWSPFMISDRASLPHQFKKSSCFAYTNFRSRPLSSSKRPVNIKWGLSVLTGRLDLIERYHYIHSLLEFYWQFQGTCSKDRFIVTSWDYLIPKKTSLHLSPETNHSQNP